MLQKNNQVLYRVVTTKYTEYDEITLCSQLETECTFTNRFAIYTVRIRRDFPSYTLNRNSSLFSSSDVSQESRLSSKIA